MTKQNYTTAQQSVITHALNLVQERAATEGEFMTSPGQTSDYFRLYYEGLDSTGRDKGLKRRMCSIL